MFIHFLHVFLHYLYVIDHFYYFTMFVKLVFGFAIILTYLRYTGRTQFSQMNAIDLIGNFIMGGVVGGGLYSPSCLSFFVALFLSVFVLFCVNYLYLKTDLFYRVTIGTPIPIIRDGHFLMDVITARNSNIDILNVASQLNLQGIFSFSEVAYAQLEPNGSLTVTCDEKCVPATVVIYHGIVRSNALASIEKTEEELEKDMKSYGISDPSQIFLAEYGSNGFIFITTVGKVFPRPRPKIINYPE
ncbi:DUF421 domain-containing protein [Acetobacteraceae bacterium]|nr:DUF421 domain-containing protein [Acetobacteraceae bacterium]